MIDDEINQPGENARPVFYEGGQPPSPQTPLSTAPIASPSTKREIIWNASCLPPLKKVKVWKVYSSTRRHYVSFNWAFDALFTLWTFFFYFTAAVILLCWRAATQNPSVEDASKAKPPEFDFCIISKILEVIRGRIFQWHSPPEGIVSMGSSKGRRRNRGRATSGLVGGWNNRFQDCFQTDTLYCNTRSRLCLKMVRIFILDSNW